MVNNDWGAGRWLARLRGILPSRVLPERSDSAIERLALSVAFGGTSGDHALTRRVHAAQVGAVIRLAPYTFSANVFNLVIILYALAGSVPLWAQLLWAGAILTTQFVALRGWWRSLRQPVEAASPRALRAVTIHASILSALWTLGPLGLMMTDDPANLLLIACVSTGLICAGGFALATVPMAATAWVVITALAAAGTLLIEDLSVSLSILLLLCTYCLIVLGSVISTARLFVSRFLVEAELQQRGEVIHLLLNDFEQSSSDWLWETDAEGVLQRASSRFSDVAGVPVARLQGHRLQDLKSEARDPANSWTILDEMMTHHQPFREHHVPVRVNGELRWWSLTGRPDFDERGRFRGYRGVGSDVTEARRARDLVTYMAEHDPLTGVGNRNWLLSRANDAMAESYANGTSVSLLMVDLDNFKAINDTRGHPVGDEILNRVAQRFRTVCEGRADLARIGGDEFAVLHMSEHREETERLANDLIDVLKSPITTEHGHHALGATIGIATAPRHADTIEDLMRVADIALYRAKRGGRGQALYFELEMERELRERRELENALRYTLERGGLSLAFQPIVSARSGEVVSCEALLRWEDPVVGSVPPSLFVPVAEEAGLIVPIGAWVLREACRRAMEEGAGIDIAVNLSPLQFAAPGLVDTVRAALAETGLPPERLILEITESVLIQDFGSTSTTLSELSALGVRIALDDFGTGYSSLSYLRQYRFDRIKIDRSFVAEIGRGGESVAIISAVIILARSLDMEVTAEGVESEAQAEMLRLMGCDSLQGYYFGRPASAFPQALAEAGREAARGGLAPMRALSQGQSSGQAQGQPRVKSRGEGRGRA
ncbi:EAL domain-containing protein [Microvirga tunisiensis]|uniref:EAL domain-containing protein n=1 Tax=Pannonibacter tanglangensis TaxID=2750084 RepID=A0A7X5F4T4_9HYPH|nr:bifunctional diguanylate cyclase/phosphodiesterase [Pannonibacter sp. XCT-53]NBN78790.1 EAL domain-containing protein [Pannonibacter sp. XCT-53]